ncbi:MAG: LLM class F420-dependent oxidoreductase [Chloroflexota bacterium]|nr:LLM class F420-dependent oxidoreductase [Chloroflexota bacterium]
MEFGIAIPNMGPVASTALVEEAVSEAEQLGYASLWVSDHIVLPSRSASRYPYRAGGVFPLAPHEPMLEPLATLAYTAALTRRIRLGISVLIIPYRNPVLTAKMLATIDVLSGGRVILGAGIGWLEEEFIALGADYRHRGAVTEEYLMLMRALWQGRETTFHGRFYRVEGIWSVPRPAQGTIPVWIGGTSPAALRRAARWGDGWHGIRLSPPEVAQARQALATALQEQGRSLTGFTISLRCTLQVTESPLPTTRTPCTGTPEQIAADVRAYQEAGVEHLVLGPRGTTREDIRENIRRFARQVLPRLH